MVVAELQHEQSQQFSREALKLPGLDPTFVPRRDGPIVGIDLGTTNSCVAFVEGDKAVIIKSREGYATMPSIVAVSPEGKLLVGHPAHSQMVTNPTQSIYGSKRLVGRPFDSPVVEEVKLRTHYTVMPGPSGQAAVVLGGVTLTLEEVSALILSEIRALAESHLRRPVARAIITCPAFYSEHQRAAVREAGRLAGLHVERVLNEPTAAALAFGYGKKIKRKVAIFDLGGGTLDATVLNIDGESFEVISTGGDTFLGGGDFDHIIVGRLLEGFKQSNNIAFRGDRTAMQRLIEAAELAKRELSQTQRWRVHLPHLTTIDGKTYDIDVTISRDEMDELVKPLVDRAVSTLEGVLAEVGLKPQNIEDVLLVGGATRMLCVRSRLRDMFGKEPHKGIHADEAVAAGAALLANSLEKREGIRLVDVNPMSIGVALPGGRYKKVIERNTQLPLSKQYVIATTKNKQPSMDLAIYQGEYDEVTKNELLATLSFTDLPKKPKGTVKVQVSFHLSDECILTLTALELSTKREVKTTIATKGTPAVVLRRLQNRSGASGTTGVFERPEFGFVAWLKRIFGGG